MTARDRRDWWLGLVGIALLVLGSGWYQMWTAPPYRYVDEQAHAGYVLELQAGRLPTIDTPIDADHGGAALRARLATEPPRRRDVWVANNPPLPYLVAMVPAALSRSLGLAGGPLIGLRLVNLVAMTAAVVWAARLARSLASDDARVGLVAGAIVAAIPLVGFMAGLGFTDGLATLCSAAMLDALVSLCRRGPSRRQVVVVATWCALGAAIRPMTAVLAAATATMALAVTAARWWRQRLEATETERPTATAPLPPGPVWSALVLVVPAIVTSGWWYLRNVHLYGGPTGSHRLFDKFARTPPRGGALTILDHPGIWRRALRTLFTRRTENPPVPNLNTWWPLVKWSLIAVLLGAAVMVIIDQVRSRRQPSRSWTTTSSLSAQGWAAAYASIGVVVAVIAQHWAGGGSPYARYAIPALAAIASAAALVVVRLAGRWAGLALVVTILLLQARQVLVATRTMVALNSAPPGSELATGYGPGWWRLAGVAVVVIGAGALAAGLAMVRARPGSVPGPDADHPAGGASRGSGAHSPSSSATRIRSRLA